MAVDHETYGIMIEASRESILRSGVGSMAECPLFAGDSSNGNEHNRLQPSYGQTG